MQAILGRQVTKPEAAQALGVTRQSMDRYLRLFQEAGPARLHDRRHSNYHKVDGATERQIVQAKLDGPQRMTTAASCSRGAAPSTSTRSTSSWCSMTPSPAGGCPRGLLKGTEASA